MRYFIGTIDFGHYFVISCYPSYVVYITLFFVYITQLFKSIISNLNHVLNNLLPMQYPVPTQSHCSKYLVQVQVRLSIIRCCSLQLHTLNTL